MRTSVLVAALACSGVTANFAQTSATRATADGVFTEAQAQNGENAYNKNCASCHGDNLVSTDREFPSLTGGPFQTWVGKTVGQLFEVSRDTMPPKEERSLPDQAYVDIVAYILRFNKFPSGNETLQPQPELLKQIVISAPPKR